MSNDPPPPVTSDLLGQNRLQWPPTPVTSDIFLVTGLMVSTFVPTHLHTYVYIQPKLSIGVLKQQNQKGDGSHSIFLHLVYQSSVLGVYYGDGLDLCPCGLDSWYSCKTREQIHSSQINFFLFPPFFLLYKFLFSPLFRYLNDYGRLTNVCACRLTTQQNTCFGLQSTSFCASVQPGLFCVSFFPSPLN